MQVQSPAGVWCAGTLLHIILLWLTDVLNVCICYVGIIVSFRFVC